MIALVKPQFEAGRDEVGKGGIVRDPAVHARVIDEVADRGPSGRIGARSGSSRRPSPARKAIVSS